jgi:aminoglycoside phosphotransferase (APT) family kinase protein
MPPTPYTDAGAAKLQAFVEQTTGGAIIRMQRMVRWRPAWFVDVLKDGQTHHLHLRGDREGDLSIFPDLKREADIMQVLARHFIQVPHIHGYCTDPPAILMDHLPGTRDMAEMATDAQRRAIAREYIQAVAQMHALPLAPFAEIGLRIPQGAEDIALAGLHAYLPHYQRTKSKPEPFLTFVLGWLRRNVPQHRTRPAFIQFDSGQFLFQNGRMTGLYDFEFSMIGDPMVDIATMRMRDSVEPLGDSMAAICRQYEEFSGEHIDDAVVEFHTLLFAALGTMQFAGTVARGKPGDQHAVYLLFDLSLRQVMLLAMSALTGITLKPEPKLHDREGANQSLIAKLADTVQRIQPASPLDDATKDAAAQLLEWLACADALGPEANQADLHDIAKFLGQPFDTLAQAEAALEAYVTAAPPLQDEPLLHLFSAIEGRRMQQFGQTRIGHAATHVVLPPLR